MSDDLDRRAQILIISLQAAVPMEIHRLSLLPEPARQRRIETWAAAAVDEVASHGDALMFGGRRGDAARPFAALARGLAALAYAPGGVTFGGVHWCTNHATCVETEQMAEGILDEVIADADEPQPTRRPVDTIAVAGGVL